MTTILELPPIDSQLGAIDAVNRLLREGHAVDSPEIVALASRWNLGSQEIANRARQARAARDQEHVRLRQQIGAEMGQLLDESPEQLRAVLAGAERPFNARAEAARRLLGISDEEIQVLQDEHKARVEREAADSLTRRLAERPPLNVRHPGVRCPVVALKSFSWGDRKVERGERFDAADGYWPPGRLRQMLQNTEGNYHRWMQPDPAHLAEVEQAIALDEEVRPLALQKYRLHPS